MEDLLVSEDRILIQSHKGQYQVDFCENGAKHLVKNLPESNFHLIIDQRLTVLYRNQLKELLEHHSILMIDAKEQNKNLECIPEYVSI